MKVDSTFVNYYYMNMDNTRENIDKELLYKLFGCKTEEELDNKINSINLAIISEIVESELTIVEYCSKYGGAITKYEKIAYSIREQNLDLYKKFRKLCTRESSEEFYLYIRSVAEEMMVKDKYFDAFDYYYYTKLNPRAFKSICEKLLSPDELKIISPILTKFKKLRYYEYTDLDVELSGVIIINGYELSYDEKYKIAQYLIEHNMPMEALKPAFRKYVNGDERLVEYVNKNQKVIK